MKWSSSPGIAEIATSSQLAVEGMPTDATSVKLTYEYLRMLPDVGAVVTLDGTKVFEHFSASANMKVGGLLLGGSAQFDAEWEPMRRSSAV
ncbi:MAG TPA: hypothetical protein VK427_20180, partial [Kofleriaceae bacterium]|nr:hypothetical protein [Kofleriaceae bacterium]